jgi:predicted nucleic acid-binding protein
MEAEAVSTILRHIDLNEWNLIGSGVINYEISKTADVERKARLKSLITKADIFVPVNQDMYSRANRIQKLGLSTYDALHIACAEKVNADILLSTDDKLVTTAQRNHELIAVNVENPLVWLQKRVQNEH